MLPYSSLLNSTWLFFTFYFGGGGASYGLDNRSHKQCRYVNVMQIYVQFW